MSFFLKSKKKDELVLVFSVGSSFVEGELFLVGSTGIPKVIFSVKHPVYMEEDVDIDRLFSQTMQSLEVVIDKVYKARIGMPEKIFCVLSSPWYVSQIRTIGLKKNIPFIFTEKLANDLLRKEINLFREEYLVKNTDGDNSSRMIEFKNIKTTLNGYETLAPINQKAKELEMIIFVSIGEETVLKKIEGLIEKRFNTNKTVFLSSAMVSFSVVRDMYPKQEDFLLINIGGEITDIFMIKKGALREMATFPLGYNFFVREIKKKMGFTLGEASALFSLLKDGHIEKVTAKKLLPTLDKLKTSWLEQFEGSLSKISNDLSVPATVYVASEKETALFFCEIIKYEQYSQYSSTEAKFDLVVLNTRTLHGVVAFEDQVVRNPFLIINSIYINRLLIKSR